MGHVLARVSGFGWTILPRYPYRLAHVEGNARALRVEHGGAVLKAATVSIDPEGPRLELSTGTSTPAEVCDLTTSEFLDAFRVETTVFTVGWPLGFDVVSVEPRGPSPFDFVSKEGSLLYIQGPFPTAHVPELEAMAAPGQRIIDRGTHATTDWIELAYERAGRKHWQRHAAVRWGRESILVLTAQAIAEQAPATRTAARFALETLEPWR